MENRQFCTGDIVKHFKGKLYMVEDIATNSETGERLVVYSQAYPPFETYARPEEMFCSKVDKEKYPNVEQEYRFELVDHVERGCKTEIYEGYTKECKLNIEMFDNCIRDITLKRCLCGDMELSLHFCISVKNDYAWYSVKFCKHDDNGEHSVIEDHKFNSIKKAVKFWNRFIDSVADNE